MKNRTSGDLEAAIGRVLDAERGARAAVAASEREAEAIRVAAHTRANRIARIAATRSSATHTAMTARRAARLDAIEAEEVGPDPDAAVDDAARARLDRAVARIADEMIGGEVAE